jgi:agmatine deiminase
MLRFEYVPYPLWRRRLPGWLRPLGRSILRRSYPLDADEHPPSTPEAMAAFLMYWGLIDALSEPEICQAIADSRAQVTFSDIDVTPQPAAPGLLWLPAQWEPVESVILTYPVLYPPLWTQHAQMVEAITPVADVEIVIPTRLWADAVWLFLQQRGRADLNRVRFSVLPTDDIWVRDYGPIVGLDEQGVPVAVNAHFDPLPSYPQARDNAMPARWAAQHVIPLRSLDLHIEGGNLLSDGAGTLIVSEQIFYSNPYLRRDRLLRVLHEVFAFDKLIVTPRLAYEETGHVDLLVKLVDANTVLIPRSPGILNRANLRSAANLFRRESNARDNRYRVIDLPGLSPYLNWGVYPIWRSYANALSVNGRVLVPTYGVPEDDEALAAYQRAMPTSEIISIDSRASIHGGGAVHCLTREVPKVRMV